MGIAESLDVAPGFSRAYAFRGHADAAWRLTPTLHRAATNEGLRPLPEPAVLLTLEKDLVAKFRELAPTFMTPATLQSTKATFDWWTVMRHYGVPTRLVDWTLSFFVAAYFAASSHPRNDGVIYAVHLHALQQSMQEHHGDVASFRARDIDTLCADSTATSVLHVVGRASALLDRMIAQQGVFMTSLNVASNIEECLADRITENSDSGGMTLRKYRLPAVLKPLVMRRLRAMNISASTLFPGLDGIGAALDAVVRNP